MGNFNAGQRGQSPCGPLTLLDKPYRLAKFDTNAAVLI